jgi:hypothetical protein
LGRGNGQPADARGAKAISCPIEAGNLNAEAMTIFNTSAIAAKSCSGLKDQTRKERREDDAEGVRSRVLPHQVDVAYCVIAAMYTVRDRLVHRTSTCLKN